MGEEKQIRKQLKGKTLLFVYDNANKREAVETVFSDARLDCTRLYANSIPQAERLMRLHLEKGGNIELIVTDYELTENKDDLNAKTGGDLYEDLRGGKYDTLLPCARTIPVVFDSGAEKPERYRGKRNVYIRASGTSLPATCAYAIEHCLDPQHIDAISRKRSFYPNAANMRDMTPDHGGYVGNDDANMHRLKLAQRHLDITTNERGK